MIVLQVDDFSKLNFVLHILVCITHTMLCFLYCRQL
jgi:hypothetical protein